MNTFKLIVLFCVAIAGGANIMAFALPGVLATIFGFLAFRSRIRGVYFSILTQALTYAACLLFFRNSLLMGGNNGFTDFKRILGYSISAPGTRAALYLVTLAALFLGLGLSAMRKAVNEAEQWANTTAPAPITPPASV